MPYRKYRIFSNRSPLPIEAPPSFWIPLSRSLFTFLSIIWLKMVRFSFRKKSLEGENALYKPLRACLSTRCFYWRIYGIYTIWSVACHLRVNSIITTDVLILSNKEPIPFLVNLCCRLYIEYVP